LNGNVSVAGNGGNWSTGNTWVSSDGTWRNDSGWEEANGTANYDGSITGGIKIHFGPNNRRAEDYYFIRIADSRTESLFRDAGQTNRDGTPQVALSTQHAAQEALERLTTAIIRKENIRANLGSLQNRLENTITNLSIQAENLQASESRISDVDIANEMTEFVRNQVLTQAAVSMLAQANSLPQMALRLLG
jgi:flagellin